MLSKSTIIFFTIGLLSTVVILVLYLLSDKHIRYRQNFTRIFSSHELRPIGVLDLTSDAYYIAGIVDGSIYLGSTNEALNLFVIKAGSPGAQRIPITLSGAASVTLKEPYIQIDSPFFYIKDGNVPALFRGEIDMWQARRYMDRSPPFTQAVPITSGSFILQTLAGTPEGKDLKNILGKITTGSLAVHINDSVLESRVGGYYSTSGTLRFSKELNQLVYTCAYSNQYMVMDTSLNLVYRGHTIDTVTTPRIKLAGISEDVYALASPPALVNRNTSLDGQWLFVHSNLMGRNEDARVFKRSAAIDVYNLAEGAYMYSFYIPGCGDSRSGSFKVKGDRLYAKCGEHLMVYDIKIADPEQSIKGPWQSKIDSL